MSTDLGADVASKMLAALTLDPEIGVNLVVESVSIDEQKRYLKKYIDSISRVDLVHIGDILVRNNKKTSLRECSEGIVINLDILADHIIYQMYELLKHKIDKLSQ